MHRSTNIAQNLFKFPLAIIIIVFLTAANHTPKGYPRSYSDIITAAEREQTIVIYSTTDANEVKGLLDAFRTTYPFLKIDYHELGSTDIYDRIISSSQHQTASADLVWSSAMDLQIKLVNDGHAQAYSSPEKPNLPPWAMWKNEAYGITAEPIVFAYNSKLIDSDYVPQSHYSFMQLLKKHPEYYKGKISTYDPQLSGAGYLHLTQDYEANHDIWSLISAIGATDPSLYASSSVLLDKLVNGEQAIAYNVIGSYALALAERNQDIKVVLPSDYTLVVSRIAIIPNEARHPNAAKLFLDFLLSHAGQTELAQIHMGLGREDVAINQADRPASIVERPVRIGPTLLTYLDQLKRHRFLERWKIAMQGE
ncbi:ABC transporter substrate-binding protein [Kordiimonas pumila]|uniref:ABC transporter substrate-binding protein n=1 Tax=Kordiimonas pumila TaxID=2161677 RepID=A0ABV7D8A1_9PROT|nr:ABC transporter substrate-binding protein [Kordiimonas pumila]